MIYFTLSGQLHLVSRNHDHNSLLDGLHEISKVTGKPSRKSIKVIVRIIILHTLNRI